MYKIQKVVEPSPGSLESLGMRLNQGGKGVIPPPPPNFEASGALPPPPPPQTLQD